MRGKKIFVGLSGGVDSAVTAALLKRAGADVVGVFIQGWYPPGMPCTWREDRRDAMRVAARLSIPFVTLDASAEYKQGVIDYLLAEYKAGNTPNPDVMCNREVKFGAFYRFAKEKGADYIATGHYARTEDGRLYRGADAAKDQSYFLWAVPKEALAMTLFPLGTYAKKAEVRALARRFNLPVSEKRDSQGICFLGAVSVDDFLRQEVGSEVGKAVDEAGNEVGTHDGAVLRTLGERVALMPLNDPVSTPRIPTRSDLVQGPWYVVAKDLKTNTLTVSKEHIASKATRELRVREANWLVKPEVGETLEVQLRYHGPRVRGTFDAANETFTPEAALSEPATAGQSLVAYRGDELIGGGILS